MSDIIVRACLKFIQIILKPVALFFFRTYYRKIDVPRPISKCHDLLLTPGHTLAEKIRNREVTSEKIVGLFIERIKQIQPILNCVVQERFDQAIEEARQVDQIMSNYLIDDKYSKSSAPLLGVPFSCKESISAKGMPNSSGLVSRKNYTAQEDSAVVKYMQEAGAILICVTNTSECCMWIESSNYITGTTRNPYNLSRIVGGSSGGEACIISACGSVWGIGSDIGGSIRIPSLFNGIYGHKPTSDLVPNDFQFPSFSGIQNKMLSIGPMCRYASDLSHLFKILCGPKYKQLSDKFTHIIDLKKLKFFYVQDLCAYENF